MKQLAAIIFSLLLIVGQTFAVMAPVSSKPTMSKPSCCGGKCDCSLNQSSAPSSAPVESNALSTAPHQLVVPPSFTLAFLLAPSAREAFAAYAVADSHAAAPPLFRRNCTLLL